MKRLSFVFFLIATITLGISSCKQGSKIDIQAPKDAMVVVYVNTPSISSKLSWEEIKQSEMFKEAYTESSDSLLRVLLQDPEKSGMDTKAAFVFFAKKQGKGGYSVFEGTVKDEAAFEKFNKETSKNAAVAKVGEGKVITLNQGVIVYWNSKQFAYVMNTPMLDAFATVLNNTGEYKEPYSFPTDSLSAFGAATLAIKGDASIGSDSRFAEMAAGNGDIHFWVNGDSYLSGLSGGLLGVTKAGDLLKGNASATTLNFENGKISLTSRSYVNEKLAGLYDKYPAKKLSADVLNRVPSKNVVALIGMNYPPEGLKELVKLTGLDGIANGFLEKVGYSIDDFVKANKGDMVIALTDLSMKTETKTIGGEDGEEPFTYTNTTPEMKVLFATSINDKAAFDKLITTLSNEAGDMKEAAKDVTYQLDNNWFVAGNNAEFNGQFLKGGNSNLPFVSKLTGGSFGAFVDIQKILQITKESSKDSLAIEQINLSSNMWVDAYMTTGEFKNNSVTSIVEINLKDKNSNSLKQLHTYFGKMEVLNKARRDRQPSFQIEPVPDEVEVIEAPKSSGN